MPIVPPVYKMSRFPLNKEQQNISEIHHASKYDAIETIEPYRASSSSFDPITRSSLHIIHDYRFGQSTESRKERRSDEID
jgi:hypothetical protein